MSNPFLEDEESNDETPTHVAVSQLKVDADDVPVDLIAEQLIKKQYILTALELHTETQERGKELPCLRNYFSNPSNFEQQINCKDISGSEVLHRTGSCSTFDSLDLTRISDDGQQVDDRVAVLEFELRKAKDTIKSLRANLTVTAEQSSCVRKQSEESPVNGRADGENVVRGGADEIKPLEIRAINHLVNEYLLERDYKLSSITFSDENEEQDFEDWDDVGINTSKPPGLLKLYRDYNHHVLPKATLHTVGVMTDDVKMNFDAEAKTYDEIVKKLERDVAQLVQENKALQLAADDFRRKAEAAVDGVAASGKNKTEQDEARSSQEKTESRTEADTPPSPSALKEDDRRGKQEIVSSSPPTTYMSSAFYDALLIATQSAVEDSWLKTEVLRVCRSPDELVQLLARCLPHIVPTVLLAKRDQLVPLLCSASALHGDEASRNELLNLLFNLIKKPTDSERQMILHGCVAYARHVGRHRAQEELLPQCWEQIGHKYPERRQLVAEACGAIAPYLQPEMRGSLLVSILQQIEQEEKTEGVRCSVVKSLAIVYAFLDDDDKYEQAYRLLRSFLQDRSATVRQMSVETLLPVLAHWALARGTLHSHLLDALLADLEAAVKNQAAEQLQSGEKDATGLSQIQPVRNLLPYLFVSVLLEIDEGNLKSGSISDTSRHTHVPPTFANSLTDPRVVIGDEQKFLRCLQRFHATVEDWSATKRFEVLTWTIDRFIPRFIAMCKTTHCAAHNRVRSLCELMSAFCDAFGKACVAKKITKQFVTFLSECAENLATAVLPVYVITILVSAERTDSKDSLSDFIIQSIVSLAESNLSLASVSCTLTFLRSMTRLHDTIVQIIWSCVMHDVTSVRAAAASLSVVMTTEDVDATLLSSRVLPALITLSTDENTDVRIATIPSLAAVVENPTVTAESVDRVVVQLVDVMSAHSTDAEEASNDGTLLGRHSVRLLVVEMSCRMAATAHPKFVDEFLLPHLVVIAASNNQQSDVAKRSEMALALLQTYTNLSCCFISTNLLQGSFLPSLKYLLTDMEALHPEHVNTVTNLIHEAERRLEQGSVVSEGSPRLFPRGPMGSVAVELGQAVSTGADDARRRFKNTWDQLKAKAPSSPTKFPWHI